jgi:hypothetical protein
LPGQIILPVTAFNPLRGRKIFVPAHATSVMDIQQSPDWARDLLAKITDVKSGVLPSWERIGNAYRLQLSAEGALIEDLVGPPGAAQRVPLEEVEAAVTAWIERIG